MWRCRPTPRPTKVTHVRITVSLGTASTRLSLISFVMHDSPGRWTERTKKKKKKKQLRLSVTFHPSSSVCSRCSMISQLDDSPILSSSRSRSERGCHKLIINKVASRFYCADVLNFDVRKALNVLCCGISRIHFGGGAYINLQVHLHIRCL